MSPRKRNVIVGVFVLIGLGIITWMVLFFAGRVAQLFAPPGVPITLVTTRADGLSDGSTVTYLGVQVGRVDNVRRAENNKDVLIQAHVDAHPALPADVHGVVRVESALGGNAEVALELTGPPEGTLKAGAYLTATYEGNSLLPPEVTQLASDLRRQQLIKHLDETIMSIRVQAEKAGAVLDSVQQVIGDPKLREDLRVSLNNIRTVTERANRIGSNLEQATGDLEKTTQQTNALMSEIRVEVGRLGTAIDHVQSVAQKIDQGKGTAGLLVNDPRLYQGLVDTSRQLNLTIADLQRLVQQWEQEGVTLKLNK